MCGIIAGIAERNIVPILLKGLSQLEYRGYDSAGIGIIDKDKQLQRLRAVGKVDALKHKVQQEKPSGYIGVAHTRWATHGIADEINAHPHVSTDQVVLVHNGIVENYLDLKQDLLAQGYHFTSQTDTEVIAHLLVSLVEQGLDHFQAIQKLDALLIGSYALAVIFKDKADTLYACRQGSPLLIGVGIQEYFVASDLQALLPVTQQYIVLEEGDQLEINLSQGIHLLHKGQPIDRPIETTEFSSAQTSKDGYKHFMQKEIFEQPHAIMANLAPYWQNQQLNFPSLVNTLKDIETIHIIACGTSYHAGLVAKYWFEELGIACMVEVASEYRYRSVAVPKKCLFLSISQSGETADTLAALRVAQQRGYHTTLAICNVAQSSLVRESALVLLTYAGPEIGVASTKAFTSQLLVLYLLTLQFATLKSTIKNTLLEELNQIYKASEAILKLDQAMLAWAQDFVDREHTLFLARGSLYPIAIEAALKLKEISYIHAEAYPAGELKHGPLALVDKDMPVIMLAQKNIWGEKLKSNLQEVSTRGGCIYLLADKDLEIHIEGREINIVHLPIHLNYLSPLLYVIPLQLFAYHVAVLRGTDVDQPRNLAKAVTVE